MTSGMANAVKRIGLISDTHGLLRKEAVEALRGSEVIIHAGDVGKPEILEELRKIAPVVAVRGNVDTEPWAKALPETAVLEAGAAMIYVLHDVKALDLNPAASGFHIVVSGPFPQTRKDRTRWRAVPQSGKLRAAEISAAGDGGAADSRTNNFRGGVRGSRRNPVTATAGGAGLRILIAGIPARQTSQAPASATSNAEQ